MINFNKDVELDVVFNNIQKEDELPNVNLYVLDDNDEVIAQQSLSKKRQVSLPAKALNKSKKVILTRQSETLTSEDIKLAKKFSRRQILQLSLNNGTIDLSRRNWLSWLPNVKVCVSGKVRKCYWWPLLQQLQTKISPIYDLPKTDTRLPFKKLSKLSILGQAKRSEESLALSNLQLLPLFRCRPVCEGLVEIYERICCTKIVITPSIIKDLCEILKDRLIEVPELPFPPELEFGPIPRPDPAPIPFEAREFFKNGASDQLQLNAAEDVQALSTLSFQEAEAYILARPYLIDFITSCGEPVLKGAAVIGENGEFSLCYSAFPLLSTNPLNRCRREVAFKVTQNTGAGPRVIYDGVGAGQWFDPSDENIVLTTYDSKAIACEPTTDVPGPDGAYVALARIGTGTDSVHLDSPDQNGEQSVTAPFSATAGLAFPDPDLEFAKGKKKNLNWGGVLPIHIDFSKGMASTKAKYYRIGVARANAAGQAITTTQKYLEDAITWYYNEPEFSGGSFTVKRKTMPLTDPGDPTFHKIPYDKLISPDGSWRDNQYHGFIDTREFDNDRYLVTIEVFNADFERVVPVGTGTEGDKEEPFSYEAWNHIDNTTTVPYGALTHLFWWDNRALTTKIEDLRKDDVASSEECQFMQKPAGATDALFSTGFRAHHAQHGPLAPDFLMNWSLRWKRGLGGAQDTLDSGVDSVGFGSSPAISASESFSTMLNQGLPSSESNQKCTFSLMLFAAAKTWDGSRYVNPNALRDVASFALDIS